MAASELDVAAIEAQLAAEDAKKKADQFRLSDADRELERFLDIPIDVGVQLDSKPIRLEEILGLRKDSVIQLSRSAGENVDLLLEGEVVGNGEIVVIEDMMGLRVTDLYFGERGNAGERAE